MVQKFNLSNATSGTWIAVFKDHQDLIYKATEVPIPSVGTGETALQGPDEYNLYEAGDKLFFDVLSLTFLVDSDWGNYKNLFNWMKSNAATGIADARDLNIILLDPNGVDQALEVCFFDCFPTNLGQVALNSTGEQTDLICTVTLRYTNFDFI